ncbi:MAG: UDP-N-acetylmuramoyl-tripeptide--D-alanyl-D-alanine ligase [Gammaproteobacteria bacterium]|nr:UDP-N-acetylmuramoyl-tripeptide--D-alanyl-D-alanine ligase [Gammaproteobacteria bacterium]
MITSLSAAAKAMHGELHGDDRQFATISTDSRTLREGELFFALQGPNFDGCNYVRSACDSGAAAAVVPTRVSVDIPQIVVADTRLALGQFASAWRNQQDVTVIGITGSNGKTGTKELVRACLLKRAPTLATQGNLNNEIGVPLMLARITAEHRFAVIEMGANHPGEIAYLTGLARPDIVVITNAAEAHLEGFGSVRGVSRAKGEILQGDERPQAAILNVDDEYFDYWSSLVTDVRKISFGLGEAADVRATNIVPGVHQSTFQLQLPNERIDVSLPLPGIHNVRNACAAAAVACFLDIDAQSIREALEGVSPVGGRLQPLQGTNAATLFDDSYNANPLSVIAAAEFLSQLSGESWLVLGDMKELGENEAELHRELGEKLRKLGIDRLYAIGDLTRHTVEGFGEHANWYGGIDALLDDLTQKLNSSANVLVKGSRSMHMERVVDALREVESMRREA